MKRPPKFWRETTAHKGSQGRLAVLAGSKGFVGAGRLCAQGAVVAGCGHVRWLVPDSLYSGVATSFLDGLVTPVWDGGIGIFQAGAFEEVMKFSSDALVAGPGWGIGAQQLGLLEKIIAEFSGRLVLDADALSLLKDTDCSLKARKGSTVLTPHPGEAARLLNVSTEEIQKNRRESVQELQRKMGAIVILKGPHTLVASESELWENDRGSATLATAGSGDVLAGMIGALMARKIEPFAACQLAVHWHALAGEELEREWGIQGMGASALMSSLKTVQKKWWDEDSSH